VASSSSRWYGDRPVSSSYSVTPGGVDVRAGVEGGTAGGLLRGHVRGRTHHLRARRRGVALGHEGRDAEVHQHRPLAARRGAREEDVFGLHVTVHHPRPMDVVQRVEDGREHVRGLGLGHTSLAVEARGERLAVEEGHRVEGRAVFGVAGLVDLHDVPVRHRGDGAGLSQKTLRGAAVVPELGPQDLERDPLSARTVARLVHRTHAALADEGVQLVAACYEGAHAGCGSARHEGVTFSASSRGSKAHRGAPPCRVSLPRCPRSEILAVSVLP
jgi:hypothetical protein